MKLASPASLAFLERRETKESQPLRVPQVHQDRQAFQDWTAPKVTGASQESQEHQVSQEPQDQRANPDFRVLLDFPDLTDCRDPLASQEGTAQLDSLDCQAKRETRATAGFRDFQDSAATTAFLE